jgi:uncharacterized phage protein (TIGR02218 family)
MSGAALQAHLALGVTTLCRAWIVTRRDGLVMGFTDHDQDLFIEGVTCRADAGLSAKALQQTTGLSVDNSEAVGALSDASITEADIQAGRLDGAEVKTCLVNWSAPEENIVEFRGFLGEITRSGGAFRAELRGLTELLNQPQGFAFQPGCSAVLGDRRCKFDTGTGGFFVEIALEAASDGRVFHFKEFPAFADRWFQHGRLEVVSGEAAGLIGVVKIDRLEGEGRRVELWQAIPVSIAAGSLIKIIAGCDKSAGTCREKFGNFLNFRGFPHIPGEDWLSSYPGQNRTNSGGSRFAGVEL